MHTHTHTRARIVAVAELGAVDEIITALRMYGNVSEEEIEGYVRRAQDAILCVCGCVYVYAMSLEKKSKGTSDVRRMLFCPNAHVFMFIITPNM